MSARSAHRAKTLAAARAVVHFVNMIHLCTMRRLLTEDDGQDLIEYALLSAFIGLAGVAVFNGIGTSMQTAYDAWEGNANSNAVVEMPPPTGS